MIWNLFNMIFDKINNIFKSVFTKLLLIMLITGAVINFLVVAFFHLHEDDVMDLLKKNVVLYSDYVIKELGTPPSLQRAQEFARQSEFGIRYESPDLTWSTSEDILTIEQLHSNASEKELFSPPDDSHFQVWRLELREIFDEKDYIEIRNKDGKFIFFNSEWHIRHSERVHVMAFTLAGFLTVVIIAAYLAIRRILNPVILITHGVRQVGTGNLEYQLNIKRSDELGEMAAAFNDMTACIKDMLHAREQLLLDVSHELRSPLTRMKVALEFMPENQVKDNIREDVSEMEKMVTEILETARLRNKHARLNWQKIDMTELVSEMIASFNNQPPGFQADNMPDTLMTGADPELIKTVLKNILGNALKYSADSESPVIVTLSEKESYVIIKIRDRGIGIPREELPYIFEPFYRVDKSRSKDTGGYGLGLSLCKTIMEAHHGKIEIESSLEKGTTVSLFLPDAI
ncbi:HAMP domain-containing sensor histidine kinase [Desulfococcaceae bacterium HSG8]|nr:HAMP domain-containing sensor histidine kinase [Desulfococcaceae bacterium HSG8]